MLTYMRCAYRACSITVYTRTNTIEISTVVTPAHILPEWYFLSVHGVLKSIPSKVCGLLGLVLVEISVLSLLSSSKTHSNNSLITIQVVVLITLLVVLWYSTVCTTTTQTGSTNLIIGILLLLVTEGMLFLLVLGTNTTLPY